MSALVGVGSHERVCERVCARACACVRVLLHFCVRCIVVCICVYASLSPRKKKYKDTLRATKLSQTHISPLPARI